MSGEILLGIDVGTSSAKAVLADTEGKFFAHASSAYSYTRPAPRAAEQDPTIWWHAVCQVTRQLMWEHPEATQQLRGIAISGQGVAAVVLDQQLSPVRNAMLWMDTRAAGQAERLNEQHGPKIARISGKKPAAYNVEPKLLWMRENEPELWQTVSKVTTTTGYINLRLSGSPVMNHSDAGIMLSYDLHRHAWSDELRRDMELRQDLFCELAESTTQIGVVTEAAASDTTLPAGLPVFAGGEDTSSAGLAMGVTAASDVQLSVGTACTVYVPISTVITDERLLAFPHVLPGLTLLGGSMISGGISIEWILKILGFGESSRDVASEQLRQLTSEAEEVDCTAEGLVFLPYLAGELQPLNDSYARGVFLGLSLDTGRAHLLRAVMEGTAFGIRHNLDVARECGARPENIRAVGGPSRNPLWCQIVADVSGLQVHVMDDHAGAAFGDAILAAIGSGLITDAATMQRAHAKPQQQFSPRATMHARYEANYQRYLSLYPRVRDLFCHTA